VNRLPGWPVLLLAMVLVLCSSCRESPLETSPQPGARTRVEETLIEDREELILDEFEKPIQVVEEHMAALENLDYVSYESLLHGDFEFCPRPEDVVDFPWLEGPCWGRDEELTMIGHMMDSTYVGLADPVQQIDIDYLITSLGVDGLHRYRVTCLWTALILTGPASGWLVNTQLAFHIVPNLQDSRFHIIQLEELDAAKALVDCHAFESNSWAQVKAVYR
jgi:hypothetical protein